MRGNRSEQKGGLEKEEEVQQENEMENYERENGRIIGGGEEERPREGGEERLRGTEASRREN